MIASGWEIDAHSVTHPDLRRVSARRLAAEVAGSRRTLQARFGVASDFFAYPYGRFDPAVRGAVRRAGFLGATTTTARTCFADRRSVRARTCVGSSERLAVVGPANAALRRLRSAAATRPQGTRSDVPIPRPRRRVRRPPRVGATAAAPARPPMPRGPASHRVIPDRATSPRCESRT